MSHRRLEKNDMPAFSHRRWHCQMIEILDRNRHTVT